MTVWIMTYSVDYEIRSEFITCWKDKPTKEQVLDVMSAWAYGFTEEHAHDLLDPEQGMCRRRRVSFELFEYTPR